MNLSRAQSQWRREEDPLLKAVLGLTPSQRAALDSNEQVVVVEGGNQSGKTWTACIDASLYAVNEHPLRPWPDGHVPGIWYATKSYELFSQQAWGHIKSLLLFKGESEYKLPTYRIEHIQWDRMDIPKLIKLRNGVDIVVKAYGQGRGQFQAKTLDHVVIDEECDNEIWDELQARMFASKSPRIFIAATPLLGKKWLDGLRQSALEKAPYVSHHRLKTLENPGANMDAIRLWYDQCKEDPDKLRLRLEGIPYFAQGLVYPDGLWRPEHVCEPFDVPREWTRYRCVDYGYRNCACVWMAVSPPKINTVVVYRDYLGRERTISQNAEAITQWERRGENYAGTWIDPGAMGTDAESGEKIIDLWRFRGYDCEPAPDNRVLSGIERCKELMSQIGGPLKDRPRLRVFRSCVDFIRERRAYKWNETRDKGDERRDMPEKRDDHVMDAFRYIVAGGLDYHQYSAPKIPCPDPNVNPVGYALWRQRHPHSPSKL